MISPPKHLINKQTALPLLRVCGYIRTRGITCTPPAGCVPYKFNGTGSRMLYQLTFSRYWFVIKGAHLLAEVIGAWTFIRRLIRAIYKTKIKYSSSSIVT